VPFYSLDKQLPRKLEAGSWVLKSLGRLLVWLMHVALLLVLLVVRKTN